MVIGKTLGIVLAIVGIIGIAAWAIPDVKAAIPNIEQLGDMPLIVISVVIALIGVFLFVKGSGGRHSRAREVPIYHGKQVVGYRRH